MLMEGPDDATGVQRTQIPEGAVGTQKARNPFPSRDEAGRLDEEGRRQSCAVR